MTITELAKQIMDTEGPKPEPSVLPAPFAKEDDVSKIGPKEAALQAARADLSIPESLDRTKGMSKDDFDKLHDKLGKPAPKRPGAKLKLVPPEKPSTLTTADKKAIAELKATEKKAAEEKKAARLAELKAANVERKAIRDEAKKAKAANAPQKPADKPKPAPTPKTAKAAKPASEARKGSKTALIGELLGRKNGCTSAEVLAATGWPAVSMPQQAKAVGVKLRKEKKPGEVTRYFAA